MKLLIPNMLPLLRTRLDVSVPPRKYVLRCFDENAKRRRALRATGVVEKIAGDLGRECVQYRL